MNVGKRLSKPKPLTSKVINFYILKIFHPNLKKNTVAIITFLNIIWFIINVSHQHKVTK